MKKYIVIFALLEMILGKAIAVPLFGETAGTIKHGILTLYKDHENPNKVYFFPNSTRFSTDNSGIPLFNFVNWGLSPQADKSVEPGAYMTISTHLAMDKDQRTALDNYIASYPNMEVAVLPIKSSIIGLTSTAREGGPLKTIFTEFNFSKVGGRAEDEIGINAVLTATGARAFKALLSGDQAGSLIKFDYCYNIQGYGPNMNARVTVDMKHVYDFMEAKASLGWFWNVKTIRAVTETLHENHDISITMNGGDAKQWEVLEKVAESITTRLFTPELKTSDAPQASTNAFFNFKASSIKKEEIKKETWDFVRRDLVEREFCTAVVIKDLQPYLSKLVTSADQE